MVVVQKTNNMGRKLRVKKQKGKANKYFIGDKQVSEKEYVKTYTDAVNEGKKVNPDFKPRSVKEMTSPATLKKRSGFKLRSGNKTSIAMLKLFSGPQHTRTRDTIKKVKQKASDAYTYAKGFTKELFATRGMGASGAKYPGRAGREAVRAKNKPLVIKDADAIHKDRAHLIRQPKPKVPKTAKERADVIKKFVNRKKK